MKTIQFKRILGVFILICVITAFSHINVYADDVDTCTGTNYEAKYGASIEQSSSDSTKYIVSLNPDSVDESYKAKLKKVEFQLIKINDTAVSDGTLVVSGKKSLTITGKFDSDEMTLTFLTTSDPDCNGEAEFSISITNYKAVDNKVYVYNGDKTFKSVTSGEKINCDNYTSLDKTSFKYQFCLAKRKATKNVAKYDSSEKNQNSTNFTGLFDNSKTYSDVVNKTTTTLKCNYLDRIQSYTTDDEYYVNKSYLYGSGTNKINTDKYYTYHYSPTSDSNSNTTVTGASASCEVECEEAVTVEYGPPVASKAGLCFEYKVKVTSRVSCSVSKEPTKPDTSINVCTPTPICTNSTHSYYVNQGGPSEEFDSCIEACDGGKYTDKCSKKCYKKVYGSSSSKTDTELLTYSSTLLTE
jgi:hypothetical protein